MSPEFSRVGQRMDATCVHIVCEYAYPMVAILIPTRSAQGNMTPMQRAAVIIVGVHLLECDLLLHRHIHQLP